MGDTLLLILNILGTLYLVYFEDMSYRDAATVMNKSESQITKLVYRGKQSLKAILEQEGFSYADK